MQPQVSLNYSSRSGLGVAGVGWSLSAGGAITRCPQTVAQDGRTKGVTFEDDRLCLNGQRLVAKSGVYGGSGTTYTTEMDSFITVTQFGPLGYYATYFEVTNSDGSKEVFGKSADSRVRAGGQLYILSWLLESKHDVSGKNHIAYYYDDFGSSEKLLSSILYTGDGATDGDRKVDIEYADSGYYSTSYLAGGISRKTKRIKSITTSVANNIVREYKLGYQLSNISKKTLLTSIEECGYKGASLKCRNINSGGTQFSYSASENATSQHHFDFSLLTDSSGNELIKPTIQGNLTPVSISVPRGDIDGNGSRDWVNDFTNAEGETVGENNFDYEPCSYNPYTQNRRCLDADFDMDGRTDTWLEYHNGRHFSIGYTREDPSGNLYADYSIASTSKVYLYSIGTSFLGSVADVNDYNGDGWPDIMVVTGLSYGSGGGSDFMSSSHTKMAKKPDDNQSTKNGFIGLPNEFPVYRVYDLYLHSQDLANPYPKSKEIAKINIKESLTFAGDLNGDGLPDLNFSEVAIQSDDYNATLSEIWFSKVDGQNNVSFDKVAFEIGGIPSRSGLNSYENYSILIDINGDGLDDWLGWANGYENELLFKLNKGDGSFTSPTLTGIKVPTRLLASVDKYGGEVFFIEPKFKDAFKSMDIDGDGKMELIMPSDDAEDLLVEGCYTFHEVRGSTSSQITRCGSDIYNLYRMDRGGQVAHASPESHWDRNIYRYKAIKFTESKGGKLTAAKINTDLIGSANHSFVVDAFGNGLSDLVFSYGCEDESCQIDTSTAKGEMSDLAVNKYYINRNYGVESQPYSTADYQPADMLTHVTNGVGVTSTWEYRPLSSDVLGQDFYEVDRTTVTDGEHFLFGSSMYVVGNFTQSNGIGGSNTTSFKYKNAMYNAKGRGFRGFEEITEHDSASDITTVTKFKQKFPYSSLILEQSKFKGTDTTIVPFSSLENDWVINQNHNVSGAFNVFNQRALSVICDELSSLCNESNYVTKTETTISQSDVDMFGNVSSTHSSTIDSLGTYDTTIEMVFLPSDEWPHRVESKAVTKSTSQNGGDSKYVKTNYEWNAQHRKPSKVLVETSDGSKANSIATEYSTYGLPKLITKVGNKTSGVQESRITDISYSLDGYFAETVSQELGHVTKTETDRSSGLPISFTDVSGLKASYTYDEFSRLTSEVRDGYSPKYTRYQLADFQSPTLTVSKVITLQKGSPQTVQHIDELGRVIHTKTQGFNGEDIHVEVAFNARGLKAKESNPYIDAPSYTNYLNYDVFGRVGKKISPQTQGSLNTTYSYAGLTTTINVTPDYGHHLSMSRTSNSIGQLVQTVDDIGGITSYSYDANGNPVVINDANNNQITASYDSLNRKLWVNDPNKGLRHFRYNDFGELEKEFSGSPNSPTDIISYSLDKLGRVTTRSASYGGNSLANFTWDTRVKGLLSYESESGIQKNYFYDSFARLQEELVNIDSESYSTKYGYHSETGHMTSMTYPNELVVGFQYNNYGYLVREYNAASNYSYRTVTEQDAFGQIKSAMLGDSNAAISVTNNHAKSTGQMWFTKAVSGQGTIHHITYDQYDSYGNLHSKSNLVAGMNATESYDYDSLHRLTSSVVNVGASSTSISYGYDSVGNIEKKSDYSINSNGAYTYKVGTNQVQSVQLAGGGTESFEYDKFGNLTHRNGNLESQFNAFNKPTRITRFGADVRFTYGADLMRYKQERIIEGKTLTTHYIGKHYEREFDSFVTNSWKERSYVSDVAIISDGSDIGSQSIRFTLRDRLGSTTTFADHNGFGVSYRFFDPFGKPRSGDWSLLSSLSLEAKLSNNPLDIDFTTNKGFTDHEHIDNVQFIHMNGRVYDYNLGRFLSVDPYIQGVGNSQGINPYSYIMNNPLSGTDPSGYKGDQIEEVKEADKVADTNDSKKVTVTKSGSRLKAVVTVKSNGAVSSRSASAASAVKNFLGSTTEIGSQSSIATSSQSTNKHGEDDENTFVQSNKGDLDKALGEVNSLRESLPSFETEKEAATWLNENAGNLQEKYGAEVGAIISKVYGDDTGFRIGSIVTSYHSNYVNLEKSQIRVGKLDFIDTSIKGRSDWHTHKSGSYFASWGAHRDSHKSFYRAYVSSVNSNGRANLSLYNAPEARVNAWPLTRQAFDNANTCIIGTCK